MTECSLSEHLKNKHGLTLQKQIGNGRTSTIFLATDQQDRKFAIKVFNLLTTKEGIHNKRLKMQYELQNHLLSILNHKQVPNIVKIHNNGCHNTTAYIIMDYIAGKCLQSYLQTHRLDPIYSQTLQQALKQLLQTLQSLHSLGLIHHDLKLQNILISPEGKIWIIDFGAAQLEPNHIRTGQWAEIERLDEELNGKGDYLVGSRHYLAPELVGGRKARVISTGIDIWAVGVMLYRLWCGQFPFMQLPTQNTSALYHKIRAQQPSYPSTMPPLYKQLLTACLNKDPGSRPPALKLLSHCYLHPATKKALIHKLQRTKIISYESTNTNKKDGRIRCRNVSLIFVQDKEYEHEQEIGGRKQIHIMRVDGGKKEKKILGRILVNGIRVVDTGNKIVTIREDSGEEKEHVFQLDGKDTVDEFITNIMEVVTKL